MYRYESHAFYASREDYEASGHSHAHGDGCGCTSCRDGRDDEGRSPDTSRWDIDGWKPLNSASRADATDGWSGTVLTDDLIRFDKVDGWNQSVAPRQTTPEADNTGGHSDGCACPSCAEVRGEQEFVLNGKRWEVDPVVHQVGSTVTWSMATSNYAADFIQFSSFITNQQFIGVIRAAFDAWEAVTNVNFVEVTDSSNVDIRLGFGQLGGPSGTLGIANYSFSVPSNILVESFIRFDIAETWHYSITPQTDDISAYLVALHEIGHVLGIDHSDVGEAVMTASINEDLPGLTQDDIDAVQAIYGARTVNTPSNQAPTDIGLSASSVTENAAAGTQIGVLSTTDPDAGDNHSYQILPAQSGAGVGNFAISGDRLVLANNASIDFEGQTSFSIAIRATDGDGASVDETFTINVTNVPISDIAVTSGGSVTENASAGTTVASFQAREGTVNQSATFSLVNDAGGLFVLNGNTLRVANGADIDYETATSHTVRLSASDGSGGTYQEDFVVAVTNMAISDIALVSGGSVAENATTGTTVATFEASENPVEPTAQFALLNDAGGRFVLDGNALKVASGASFDDQLAASHTVRISATDGTGAARVEDFTISVTNTDIPISDITVTSGGTVTENAGQGTSVAQFGITGGAPSATLSLVNDAGGLFVLDGNTLRVAAGADIDFETATSHTLRVSASDGSGPAYQEDVTIQVGNVAVSDIVLVSGGTVTENAAGGTSVAAFQAREGTVSQNATFSLVNDAGGLFVLDGNTLKVASGAALDFETATSHTVRLSASDGSGGSYQESFVVAVTNMAISDIALTSGGIVSENATTGTTVATFAASENSVEPTAQFTLLNNAGGRFVLDGNALKVATGASFDDQVAGSHTVRISATDGTGPARIEDFTIAVSNADAPISDITLTSGGTVTENAGQGTSVAQFGITGGSAAKTLTLANDAGGLFVLDGNTLRVAAGADIDFETATSHTVRVSASDGSGPAYQEDITIQVANMAISDIALVSGGTVAEDATVGATVATFEASENPVEPTAQFTMVDDAGGRFVLDGGALKVATGAS
ncbi:MAG: cadherin domain-containing protein, partial [Pseudomonadota bacterium]